MIHFDILTLIPEMFTALNYGVIGRALTKNIIQLHCFNPRDFTKDKYHKVDDSPYGGGAGMVMMVEPLHLALQAAKAANQQSATTIYLSPQGKLLNHQLIKELSEKSRLILVAGRYEGIDERFLQAEVDQEISLGDYVISGGELAAMVLIDAITRQLPNVLGDADSAKNDSFVDGLLDYPHYTRPESFAGMQVPPVLLSGDHQAIARWRRKQALGRTYQLRPDLLQKCQLTSADSVLLNEFIEEMKG